MSKNTIIVLTFICILFSIILYLDLPYKAADTDSNKIIQSNVDTHRYFYDYGEENDIK